MSLDKVQKLGGRNDLLGEGLGSHVRGESDNNLAGHTSSDTGRDRSAIGIDPSTSGHIAHGLRDHHGSVEAVGAGVPGADRIGDHNVLSAHVSGMVGIVHRQAVSCGLHSARGDAHNGSTVNSSGHSGSDSRVGILDLDIDVGQNAFVELHEDHIVLVVGDLVDGAGNQLAVNVDEVDLNVLGIRIGRAAQLDDVVLDGVGRSAVSHVGTGGVVSVHKRILADQDTLAVVGRTIDQSVLGELALGLDGGSSGVTVDEAVILIEVTQSVGVGLIRIAALDVDDVLVVAGNGDIRSGIVEDEHHGSGIVAGLGIHEDGHGSGLGVSQRDGGNIGKALVSGGALHRAISLQRSDQEDGLGVSGVGGLIASRSRGQVHVLDVVHEGVLAVADQLGSTGSRCGGTRIGNQSQLVDVIGADGVGNDVVLAQRGGLGGISRKHIGEGGLGSQTASKSDLNGLGGAVGEEELGLGLVVQVADSGLVVQNDRILDVGIGVHIQNVAVGIQIDGHVIALINGGDGVLHGADGHLVGVILGAANGDITGDGVGAHSTGDLLGQSHGLDAVLAILGGIGVSNDVILLEGLSLELLAGAGAAIAVHILDLDVSVLGGGVGISSGDLADVGVDLNESDGLGIVVIIDVQQNAVAANLVLAALDDVVGKGAGINAVNILGDILLGDTVGQTEVGVDGADLGAGSVGQVGRVGIGADGLGLERPLGGGAHKGVSGTVQLEVGEELLAELNGVLIGVGELRLANVLHRAVLSDGSGDIGGLGAADADDRTVDSDGGTLGVILNGGGLEGVEHHLSSLLTGDNLGSLHGIQTLEELGGGHQLAGVDLPVSAGEALGVGIIAEADEQHLAELQSGQGTGGVELTVADAGDDAGGGAVVHITGRPAIGSHVGELVAADESVSGLLTELEISDQLGGLLTGEVGLGVELAVGAFKHADSAQDVHSFLEVDIGLIGISCVADGDEGHGHDQRQHQSE